MLLRRHKLFFSFLHVSFYAPLFPLSVVVVGMVVVVVVDDDDEGMNQWMV